MSAAARYVTGLLAGLCAIAPLAAAQPATAATQPGQPALGPGGSDYPHADFRVTEGGSGNDAWYVFEPTAPQPKSAPLAVIMHGYFEYSGYAQAESLIRHTVRQGNVVVYPRWQTGVADPCPGPFNIEPCISSTVNGVNGGLAYLRETPGVVRPQVQRTSYFGFSFGGIITANMLNRYVALGLPKPRAVFLEDPHDGGLNGDGEPALDHSLGGIPSDVKLQCHSSERGVLTEPGKERSSCNAVFPMLRHIPLANKDIVMTFADAHGSPPLAAPHGVCAGPSGSANAYDWNFCWKVWDGLRDAAYFRRNCRFALGDTPEHSSNGRWSDGVPVARLKIQDAAPIGPGSPDSKAVGGGCRGPKLKLRAKKTQDVGAARVSVTVDDAAELVVRGKARGAGAALEPVTKEVRAGRRVKMRLRFHGGAGQLKRALAEPGSVVLKLKVIARNGDGGTIKKRTIRLTD